MNKLAVFGGKAKGLVWLTENTDLGFQVPEFDTIAPSYYEDIIKQRLVAQIAGMLQTKATGQPHTGSIIGVPKGLEDRCKELANQFSGKSVMVRSSGVLSEDSDIYSGAGIYDSFEIRASKLSPQTLLDAVLKVYTSVESERARQYRRDSGLRDEKMEVIVQELATGCNGVALSRLQARAGIKSVSWSDIRGAAVGSDLLNAQVDTAYFAPMGEGYREGAHRILFHSEASAESHVDYLKDHFAPLIDRIRKRYGKDFEFEFVVDLSNGYDKFDENQPLPVIYAVQIRPLTNVQDKVVEFPRKTPIMESEFCVGVGEYIGPWVLPRDIREGWAEPGHYAYLGSALDKSISNIVGNLRGLFRIPTEAHLDYDALTPNKMAIVVTGFSSGPSAHAITIANERGIISLVGNKLEGKVVKRTEMEDLGGGYSPALAQGMLGSALVVPVKLAIPLAEVGPYIHIVADGLNGRVYRATEEEARAFETKLLSEITYQVGPVKDPMGDNPKWWYLEFQITPSLRFISPNNIWMDFVNHMQQRVTRKLTFKGNDRLSVYTSSSDLEVYCAEFDHAKRKDGIKLQSGRGTDSIANQQLTRQWFQEFADKYKHGYVPPKNGWQ